MTVFLNNLHRFLEHLACATEAERDAWDEGLLYGEQVSPLGSPIDTIYRAGLMVGCAAAHGFSAPAPHRKQTLCPDIPEDAAQEGVGRD